MISSSPISWKSVWKVLCILCFSLLVGGAAAAQQNFRVLARFSIPPFEMGTGISLNAALNLVYVSAGFNTGDVFVLDGQTLKLTATVSGSGASIDSKNDNYWAGGLYGQDVFVYSGTTNKLIDTINIGSGFCPGAVSFDCVLRRMWVAAQCGGGNDPVFVYNADTFALIDGPIHTQNTIQGSEEVVNPDTGRYYVLDYNDGGTDCPPSPAQCSLRIDPSTFQITPAVFGITLAVNSVTGILYAYVPRQDGNDDVEIVDGAPDPEQILTTIHLTYPLADMADNNALHHLYISNQSSTGFAIDVRDDVTGAEITTFPLGNGNTPYALAADSLRGRLYVDVGTPTGRVLYVIEDLSTARTCMSLGCNIGVGHK